MFTIAVERITTVVVSMPKIFPVFNAAPFLFCPCLFPYPATEKHRLGSPTIVSDCFRRRADTASKGGVRVGPVYSSSPSTFARDNSSRRSPVYTDEAYDFLDSGRLPHRVAHRRDRTKMQISKELLSFARMARESFMVSKDTDNSGRRTLFHIVRPSKSRESMGIRDTKY